MQKIIQKGNKILHGIAKPVPIKDITTPKIQKVLKDMVEAMSTQDDAVAIAAPQIAVPLRIFIVSGKTFNVAEETEEKEGEAKTSKAGSSLGDPSPLGTGKDGVPDKPDQTKSDLGKKDSEDIPDIIFINPEIIKLSKKTKWVEEGCLSVRPWYGEVKRSTNATIRAYNKKGELFTRGAGGLLAQIFQHETDHLEGILFDDKARDLREQGPDEED